jgi:hypothetical protein
MFHYDYQATFTWMGRKGRRGIRTLFDFEFNPAYDPDDPESVEERGRVLAALRDKDVERTANEIIAAIKDDLVLEE